MRRGVLLPGLHVLPTPPFSDEPLHRALEIARDRRIGVLLHYEAGRRVRNVDERRGSLRRTGESGTHLFGYVDELRLPIRPDVEFLQHRRLSYGADGVGPRRYK